LGAGGRNRAAAAGGTHSTIHTDYTTALHIYITAAARERTLLLLYIPATKKKVAVQKEIFKHRTKGNERRARGTEKS
jgi:hypothetical protein